MTSLATAALAADAYAVLAAMSPPARSKLLHLDCNAGLNGPEQAFLLGGVSTDFSAPVRVYTEPWDGEPREFSESALESLLREQQAAFASGSHEYGVRGPAMWFAPGAQPAAASLFRESHSLLMPALPWSRTAARSLPARFSLTASYRTVGLVREGRSCAELKIHSRPEERPHRTGPLARGIARFNRHWIMDRMFGVDPLLDGGALESLDALHSLWLSHSLSKLAGEFAIMRETAAIVGADGCGCIIRESQPYPHLNKPALAVPCHALVGSRRRRSVDLLEALSRSGGVEPCAIAIQVGRRYLHAWHTLLFQHRFVLTMPHAQNALVEIHPDITIGRIVIKDMRDIESWEAYCRWSGNHGRLIAVDRHYVRYEMAVHPIYYDVQRWSDPWAAAAAGLFNYSFQMLRNYVFRGFELALQAFDPDQARRAATVFCESTEALAGESAGGSDINLRMLLAARRLRRQWVEIAISGSR